VKQSHRILFRVQSVCDDFFRCVLFHQKNVPCRYPFALGNNQNATFETDRRCERRDFWHKNRQLQEPAFWQQISQSKACWYHETLYYFLFLFLFVVILLCIIAVVVRIAVLFLFASILSTQFFVVRPTSGPSFANYYANENPAPLKVFPFYDAKLQVRLDRAERLSKRKANKAKKGSIQAPGTKGKGK
jgi:hypothetical protein